MPSSTTGYEIREVSKGRDSYSSEILLLDVPGGIKHTGVGKDERSGGEREHDWRRGSRMTDGVLLRSVGGKLGNVTDEDDKGHKKGVHRHTQ